MDINTNLLNYTQKVNLCENQLQEEQEQLEQTVLDIDNLTINSCVNYVDATNIFCVEAIGENLTDDEIVSKLSSVETTVVKKSDVEEGEGSSSTTDDIKNTIYELYNNSLAKGYAIKDANSLFRYLHSKLGITKKDSITKEQLIKLTQDDDNEDYNHDFFGSLNRIFDELDTDKSGSLSYREIEKFLGSDLMQKSSSGNNEYDEQVNTYTKAIQADYAKLDDEGKLDYALKKTEEYLKANDMENQLYALNRLTGGEYAKGYANTFDGDTDDASTDLYCKSGVNVGQISLTEIEDSDGMEETTDLGAYSWIPGFASFGYSKSGETYEIISFKMDYDGNYLFANEDGSTYYEDTDLGIALNKKEYLSSSTPWYKLVDTLVHELTHATMFLYYEKIGNQVVPSLDGLKRLLNIGAIDQNEYNTYEQNWSNIISNYSQKVSNSNTQLTSETQRLLYLINCATGEYSAYQADADYADSIAADVYDGSSSINTAVNGSDEKQTIIDHIEFGYNSATYGYDKYGNPIQLTRKDEVEALPDYEWWT